MVIRGWHISLPGRSHTTDCKWLVVCWLLCAGLFFTGFAHARDITFCGERIPVDRSFVGTKLMNIIRSQAGIVNLPLMRRESAKYFPIIRYYLAKAGLPDDLKYIPIIESGFRNARSHAGAQGFWQLMPETARDHGLVVQTAYDERNDIYKSTLAACKELARTYLKIRKDLGISSWVLTAAAYNFGIGNLYNTIQRQGANYFSMNLNPETAVYVYKIIAIKELFEYPEYYLRSFRSNVFDNKSVQQFAKKDNQDEDPGSEFKSMSLEVNNETKGAPQDLATVSIEKPKEADLEAVEAPETFTYSLSGAHLVGNYSGFKDGDSLRVKLVDELSSTNQFKRAGSVLTGRGWIINGRVYVDLGFEGPEVVLYDARSKQGISLRDMKPNTYLILRVQE